MFPWSRDHELHERAAPATSQRRMASRKPASLKSSVVDLPRDSFEPLQDYRKQSVRLPQRSRSRDKPTPIVRARQNGEFHSSTGRSSPSISQTFRTETTATSLALGPLQTKGPAEETDEYEPLDEGDDPASYDLIAPALPGSQRDGFNLETRSQQLFSRRHLELIFADPSLLLRFTAFLSAHRPQSISMLIYYLDALKALRAIGYANAVVEGLEPIAPFEFTANIPDKTHNKTLETKASQAFDVLVREDLPAYITHLYISTVSLSIRKRVTGTMAPHLRDASEGLAEVFCMSDPTRPDNPVIFASEEFARTTQYGNSYALGRNCRFLQGPNTSKDSVRRIREALNRGQEHSEVFLNYRRDGSPFMNLLMCAPLLDSRGTIRYFIGAQVDVSGLVKECTDLESLSRLVMEQHQIDSERPIQDAPKKDEFRALSEMLNMGELETVRHHGGRMHSEPNDDDDESDPGRLASHRPRLLLKEPSIEQDGDGQLTRPKRSTAGQLAGVYSHYLLVRPYPSLRILFASPTLRIPGILQSPFMNRIGGSTRVREELTAALAEGRLVTAKVKWLTKFDDEGRNRWIHATPLIGSNGHIGVWMIVLVDDDNERVVNRRWKQAPPVDGSLTSQPSSAIGHRFTPHDQLTPQSYDGSRASDSTSSLPIA